MDFEGFLMSRAITQIFVTQVLVNFQFSIFNSQFSIYTYNSVLIMQGIGCNFAGKISCL